MDGVWQKVMLVGIGFIIGGLIGAIGLALNLFPDYKVKSSRMLSINFFALGVLCVVVGIIKQ